MRIVVLGGDGGAGVREWMGGERLRVGRSVGESVRVAGWVLLNGC